MLGYNNQVGYSSQQSSYPYASNEWPGSKVTGPNLRGSWINLPADVNGPDPVMAFFNAPARPQSFDTSGGGFQIYWFIMMFLMALMTVICVPIGLVCYLLFLPFVLCCPSCWSCVWVCESIAFAPCIFLKEICYPEPDQFFNSSKYGPHLPPMTTEQAQAAMPGNALEQQSKISRLEQEVAALKKGGGSAPQQQQQSGNSGAQQV